MPRVVFILGLCGSGKSHRANELASQGFTSFDEEITGQPVHPDRQVWENTAYDDFVKAVVAGKNCVVTEVAFYSSDLRQRVTSELKSKRQDVVIEWECFDIEGEGLENANFNCENDPERTPSGIANNLKHNRYLARLLKIGKYELPVGCRRLKTVRRTGA